MKVLFVGYKNPSFWAVTDYIEMGLRELGHEVHFFDYRSYRLPGRLRDRLPALERWDLARINRGLCALARELRPDLLLVNGGHTLEPETVRQVRGSGAYTAVWFSDFPVLLERYLKLAPAFERYFVSDSEALKHHQAAGQKAGALLAFACVPSIHKPVAVSAEERSRYGCDVAFVGTAYPERVGVMEKIARLGVDLALWGPGWERLPSGHALRPHVRGRTLRTQEWVAAASACKIAFNYMGQPFFPPKEEMANSRVFELLGCGAFQLVDAKKDVLRLFEHGRELAVFADQDEMVERIRHYLDHAEERAQISKRARRAALAAHTYKHRLTELLQTCGLGS